MSNIRTQEEAIEEQALRALIRWRQNLERKEAASGHENELSIWRAAGRLMRQRRISIRIYPKRVEQRAAKNTAGALK